ncbi:MAG: N-6 DNA methylase [Chloroflexota bacterium]
MTVMKNETRQGVVGGFARAFREYLSQWEEARVRGASHDQLRHLFTNFLRDAFPGLQAWEFDLERHITGLGVRGFIDLLYRQLVFEFKRDLRTERESGLEELTRYLSAQPDPYRVFGILTDGATFEVYALGDGLLQKVDDFRFDSEYPDAAELTLDCYLFAAKQVVPTADDIVRRFGEHSLVFATVAAGLGRAFEAVRTLTTVQTKFGEWNNLLAHVYGSPVGSEALFLRHTYLALLARLLAYTALRRRVPAEADLPGVVDGGAFRSLGITNLVEGDFFAWVLEAPAARETLALLHGLATHLGVYRFEALAEDVLKELYQHMVEKVERHNLGEYYTPDWLAERTLRDAGYGPGRSLLDPACGSGTFLFTAVRLLREGGLNGEGMVRFVFENLAGLDVHPLAVMIAKVNLIIALLPDLQGRTIAGLPPLPIFMADTLRLPYGMRPQVPGVTVPVQVPERPPRNLPTMAFTIPQRLAATPADLDAIIDRMADLARSTEADERPLVAVLRTFAEERGYAEEYAYLVYDFRLLRWLTRMGRDSVWAFILRNAYRPAYFAERKFDLVAGNPPWLSYRYIARGDYQDAVKKLIRAYGLLSSRDVHLFTQMDLSTLFFAHSVEHFLRPEGTIAFVMPRSVLTGAKQHSRFQELGQEWFAFTRILDMEGVAPLFEVPACVIFAHRGKAGLQPIPTVRLRGELPRKNVSLAEAQAHLTETPGSFTPLRLPSETSPYLNEIKAGAGIYPRFLWFVQPPAEALVIDAGRPQLETDPAIEPNAKPPWKGLRLRGAVEQRFLYATMLGEDLLPFGVRRFRLVVLPLLRELRTFADTARLESRMLSARQALERGHTGLADWLRQAEAQWAAHKKGTTAESLMEWLDWQGKLTRQEPERGFKVLYSNDGTYLAACVVDAATLPEADGLQVAGFAADVTMRVFPTSEPTEAHYLAAFLNAPLVDAAIKPYQPRGQFGATRGGGQRHIHRLPFEIVLIPRFDPSDVRHRRLAELSEACHPAVAAMAVSPTEPIGRARQRVREALRAELTEIDALVAEVVAMSE